jgi:hypothetical protein
MDYVLYPKRGHGHRDLVFLFGARRECCLDNLWLVYPRDVVWLWGILCHN